MKNIKSIFFAGLKAFIPFFFTLLLIYWVIVGIEQFLQWLILLSIGKSRYFPGLGLLIALILIFVIGLIGKLSFIQKIIKRIRSYFFKIPLIKTIYNTSVKLTSLFSKKGINGGEVVILNTPLGKIIGIVTQNEPAQFLEGIGAKEQVAVYVQMSYNMGGYTFIVPKDSLEPVDISVKEAMELTLTAYVSGKKKK